jgi:hypothetical protein
MGPIGCPRGNKMVLLKWAPVNGAGADDGNGTGKEVAAAATRRRYVPVRLLELQGLGLFGCMDASLRPCWFDLLLEVRHVAVLGFSPVIVLGTM